jgi:hypothetical protein
MNYFFEILKTTNTLVLNTNTFDLYLQMEYLLTNIKNYINYINIKKDINLKIK